METIRNEQPSRTDLAYAWDGFIAAVRRIMGFNVFRVVVDALPELEASVAKVARRAVKHGLPAPALEVLGEPFEVKRDRFVLKVVMVRMTAPVLKVGAFSFVAAAHHTPGGTLVMAAPAFHGEDLREYRALNGKRCDHCNVKRSRSHSYVLDNGTERVVVGATCVRDYLGVDVSAEAAWKGYGAIWAALMDAGKACEDELGGGGGGRWGDEYTTFYLARAIASITTNGYRKSHGDYSTRIEVGLMRNPTSPQLVDDKDFMRMVALGKSDGTLAAAAFLRGWAESELGDSDFAHNLRVAARNESVVSRSEGLLCYLYEAYRRARGEALAKRTAEAPPAPRHIGAVGERLDLGVTVVRTHETFGAYGLTTMVVLRADGGGDLTWWKSGGFSAEVGARGSLKATVKEHGEYKGSPRTTVTRGKWTAAA